MTDQPPQLDTATLAALLRHLDIAPHLAGLPRLTVAVAEEAGPLPAGFTNAGTEVRISGPVDAEAAEEAFHLSRVIAREGGRLRLDFSYPPANLSGTAVISPDGRVESLALD